MSTFDIRTDAPGMLRAEAMNITLSFTRTGPTTGRVSWNIPTPAAGCASGSQAYAGMVVVIDTTAASIHKIPTNGTVYSADATANTNLFAGDYIASSMVVGAFYNTVISFFDIADLQPNTPYFVTGYPVDAQYRYYIEGVHAYSMDFSNKGSPDTHGSQIAVMNPEQAQMGIAPTDSTGLSAALTYGFRIRVGLVPAPTTPVQSTDYYPQAPVYNITVDGANSQDYQHLVVEINKQLALTTNNIQGPTPPNAGAYYWNSVQNQLFLWDGYTYNLINAIVQSTAPSIVVVGTYWYNPTAEALTVWSGASWTNVVIIKFSADPTMPQADKTYWYNSTTHHGYLWNGAAWCDTLTYNVATDPSVPIPPVAGSYWHNTVNLNTYRWNDVLGMWTVVTVIDYLNNPNILTSSDYWFDSTTNTLYQYGTPTVGTWNAIINNVSVTEIAPTTYGNTYWYNPTTTVLQRWDSSLLVWNTLNVITFLVDPTIRNSCGLWWNTSTNTLNVWDSINTAWVTPLYVYNQGIDPTTATPMTDGTLWYNTTTNILTSWANNCFTAVPSIAWPTDPIHMIDGISWFNTLTQAWYIRSLSAWTLITLTSTTQDPNSLTTGSFWFKNTPSVGLQQWNGASWVTIMYSSSSLTPTRGTTWFNTTTSNLMLWTGTVWVAGTPTATCEIDYHGNLMFTDTSVGGLSFITLMDGTLFQSLAHKFVFHDQTPGTDGTSDQASYNELGIGTDGSVEERLALHNEIRYELGYPAVEVELTPEQLNYTIDKALSEFRARSSLAYKRGFFFMAIPAENQKFVLSSKISGMNKIVDIIGVYRLTSSFLSSAHGAGVYGQIVVQHLYNMGTFDLLSYHIMAEYTKLMEILFAARVTFTWNEQTRVLHCHTRFPFNERQVCIEATTERTEQDLLTDRYCKGWLRRYALAVARSMLAETRGKFASLPGAGGAITLNSADLRQLSASEIEICLMEIAEYIADKPEEYGKFDFTFG